MTIPDPLALMVFRPRSQLPSLLSWLLEQDAESIAAGSTNQSAEAHTAQRRSAEIVNPTQDYHNNVTLFQQPTESPREEHQSNRNFGILCLFVFGIIELTLMYSSHITVGFCPYLWVIGGV